MLAARPLPQGDPLLSGLAPHPCGASSFLRPCGAGQSVWTMVVGGASLLPRASIGEKTNVPEKSRLRCSDLRRLCVCRILVRVLGPRNSSRGGKLLTKAPASLHARLQRQPRDDAAGDGVDPDRKDDRIPQADPSRPKQTISIDGGRPDAIKFLVGRLIQDSSVTRRTHSSLAFSFLGAILYELPRTQRRSV
jgi:hypothetical protein